MPKHITIYQRILNELFVIMKLCPGFVIYNWAKENEIDVWDMQDLYEGLKEYREKLEVDNHLIADDEETKKIIDEGLRIQSLLIKEELYGEE